MRWRVARSLLPAALGAAWLAAVPGAATPQIATSGSGVKAFISSPDFTGPNPSCSTTADATLDCAAFFGSPTSPYEARAAARAGGDIAVNAQFIGRDPGDSFEFSGVNSEALLRAEVTNPGGGSLELQFLLPPSLLEFTDNLELPGDHALSIIAELDFRFVDQGRTVNVLSFEAILGGDFYGETLTIFRLESDFPLDLTPLGNPTRTVTAVGPISQTVSYAFPAFGATVDLGVLPAGELGRLTYSLEAHASGLAILNEGIAAINDPLSVSGPLVHLEGIPIVAPEPGAGALLAAALLALTRRSRRSPRGASCAATGSARPRRRR